MLLRRISTTVLVVKRSAVEVRTGHLAPLCAELFLDELSPTRKQSSEVIQRQAAANRE